LISE
jgi:hypothetical protein